jgi:hypothetical protein
LLSAWHGERQNFMIYEAAAQTQGTNLRKKRVIDEDLSMSG